MNKGIIDYLKFWEDVIEETNCRAQEKERNPACPREEAEAERKNAAKQSLRLQKYKALPDIPVNCPSCFLDFEQRRRLGEVDDLGTILSCPDCGRQY